MHEQTELKHEKLMQFGRPCDANVTVSYCHHSWGSWIVSLSNNSALLHATIYPENPCILKWTLIIFLQILLYSPFIFLDLNQFFVTSAAETTFLIMCSLQVHCASVTEDGSDNWKISTGEE
jgi:hypothetical protein